MAGVVVVVADVVVADVVVADIVVGGGVGVGKSFYYCFSAPSPTTAGTLDQSLYFLGSFCCPGNVFLFPEFC